MIVENFKNLKSTIKMAFVDLKKVYKGTALGWVWLIAKPAMTIFMYWFMFRIGMRVAGSVNGFPYFIWLIVGLLPWFYIADMLGIGANIFKRYSYLITKIKYPIATIPNFVSISRLIVNLILTIIVLTIYFVWGGSFNILMLQLPLLIIFNYVLMTNFANIFAFLGALSKDFGNFIRTIITPIMFLSPILWNINNIHILMIKKLQFFNPFHFIIKGYRNIFIYNKSIFDNVNQFLIFVIVILVLAIIGELLHKKLYKEIPDYL